MPPAGPTTTLHPDVKKLLDLQEVDQQIAHLTRDIQSLPQEEANRRKKLDAAAAARDAKKQELDSAELQQRESELAIKQGDAEIAKLNERLNTVKNNAEYQATLFQIESVKRDRDETEEDGLRLIDVTQSLRAELEATQAVVDAEQAVFDEFLAEAEKLRAACKEEVDKVADRRKELADQVPPDLLSEYERLFEVRSGLAVCAVEGQFCQGCYTNITTSDVARLMGASSVVRCDACQRILYASGPG